MKSCEIKEIIYITFHNVYNIANEILQKSHTPLPFPDGDMMSLASSDSYVYKTIATTSAITTSARGISEIEMNILSNLLKVPQKYFAEQYMFLLEYEQICSLRSLTEGNRLHQRAVPPILNKAPQSLGYFFQERKKVDMSPIYKLNHLHLYRNKSSCT